MTDELLTTADARAILGVGQNAMTRYLREIRHLRLGNPRTGPEVKGDLCPLLVVGILPPSTTPCAQPHVGVTIPPCTPAVLR